MVGYARGPWCVLKMVWLEEGTETLLPSPGRVAWELKWAQALSGMCTKPQCCGLCSDGHVLGNREGPLSDWPGKGRREVQSGHQQEGSEGSRRLGKHGPNALWRDNGRKL